MILTSALKEENIHNDHRPITYRYLNKTESVNEDICDDFKSKQNVSLYDL